MCAGYGKRLNPLTLSEPKPLLRINETSVELKKKIYNFYLKSQKNLNKKYFKNDFEIISVLRNLKIIGIFTRLAVRDNKKKYLKLIPYAWKLIKLRSQNDNFRDLNNLLKVLKKNK